MKINTQLELQRARENIRYCQERLDYWQQYLEDLELLISDEILAEVWGDDDLDYRWPDLDLMP